MAFESTPPSAAASQVLRRVLDAMSSGRLSLPSMPDVAVKIGSLIAREDVTVAQLAQEIARDPALTARLLKVTNSASIRGAGRKASTLTQAITRLGLNMTRVLVQRAAMEQMFQPRQPVLKALMKQTWSRSLEVASLARILAQHRAGLDAETAMLAGLVHLVGILPIARLVDEDPALVRDLPELVATIHHVHPRIARLVLQAWKFPDELLDVPVHAFDFQRTHPGPADYVDVVSVAILQINADGADALSRIDRRQVPAFARLGLGADVEVLDMPEVQEAYEEGLEMLSA